MHSRGGQQPNSFLEEPDPDQIRLQRLVGRIEELHRKEPEAALLLFDEAMDLAIKLNDLHAQFDILLCSGRVHVRQGDLVRGERTLHKALELTDTNDKDKQARAFLILGAVHALQEQQDLALDYYFKGLSCGVEVHKGQLYLNIANLYFSNQNYSKSLHYQKKALRLAEANKDTDHVVYCLSNIGAVYVQMQQNEEALDYFRKAIEVMHSEGQANPYMICSCELNLGEVSHRLGNLDEAEAYYKKALKVARQHKLTRELAQGYQFLGELKRTKGHISSFLHYHYRSRKLCEESGFEGLQMAVLDNLKSYFEGIGDYAKAYAYLTEIMRVRTEIDRRNREQTQSRLLEANEKKVSILEEQNEEIAEQKHKLELSYRELEQNNRELEQYAYIVAHDLKEPLRNISSFTTLIKRNYVDQMDETAQEYMGYVVRNVSKMHSLLTELLRYNTISRKGEPQEYINLNEVVAEISSELKADDKQADIIVEKLPVLKVHPFHAYQLFQNLMKNALQFNTEENCEIRIGSSWDGKSYRFWVKDNGIGIHEEYHDKIFNLFNRLDRETFEGTGIGLAMCRKIVHLYDGEIWVQSKPGSGATFYFTLKVPE